MTSESHHNRRVGLSVRLLFPALEGKDEAALELFFDAFKERVRPALEVYNVEEIFKNISVNPAGEIFFLLEGDREAVFSATQWLTKELFAFVPTLEELNVVRGQAERGLAFTNQGMTSRFAMRSSQELVARFGSTIEERLSDGQQISGPEELRQRALRIFSACDIRLAAVGDMTEPYARGLALSLRQLFPSPLSEDDRIRRRMRTIIPTERLSAWRKLPPGQGAEMVAVARRYGPFRGLSPETGLGQVLGKLVGEEVSNFIRSNSGLGYTHGAAFIPTSTGDGYIMLYGQASGGEEQLNQIVEGWEQKVLPLLHDRKLNPDGFREAVLGLSRSVELIPKTLWQEAYAQDTALEQFGRVDARAELSRLLKRVDTADMYHVAEQQFFNRPWVQVMTSQSVPQIPCAVHIATFEETRALLRGNLRETPPR